MTNATRTPTLEATRSWNKSSEDRGLNRTRSPRHERTARCSRWQAAAFCAGWLLAVSSALAGEQETPCGDANGDGKASVTDAVFLLNGLAGLDPTFCDTRVDLSTMDVNGSGDLTMGDPLFLMGHLFVEKQRLRCGETSTRPISGPNSPYRVILHSIEVSEDSVEAIVDLEADDPATLLTLVIKHVEEIEPASDAFESSLDREVQFFTRRSEGQLAIVISRPIGNDLILHPGDGRRLTVGTVRFRRVILGGPTDIGWGDGVKAGECSFPPVLTDDEFREHLPNRIVDTGLRIDIQRGDFDSNGTVDGDDVNPLFRYVTRGEGNPINCEGRFDNDVADVNDNEYVTIADPIALQRGLAGLDPIPLPTLSCGSDPSDDTRGFGIVDPRFVVTVSDVSFLPDRIRPQELQLELSVRAPRPVAAIQVVVGFDPRFARPRAQADGGPVGSTHGDTFHRILDDDALLAIFVARSDSEPLTEDGAAGFQRFGSIRLELRDPRRIPDIFWLPEHEAEGELFVTRASVVDVGLRDHHPRLLTGVKPFLRGNSNSDSSVDISDPKFTLLYLFNGGRRPLCLDAADANDDGQLDISDAIWTLSFLFGGGPRMPQPFPDCGLDNDMIDTLGCEDSSPRDACVDIVPPAA